MNQREVTPADFPLPPWACIAALLQVALLCASLALLVLA
jgi:hypothetical protein